MQKFELLILVFFKKCIPGGNRTHSYKVLETFVQPLNYGNVWGLKY